jgi:hypothetical protein
VLFPQAACLATLLFEGYPAVQPIAWPLAGFATLVLAWGGLAGCTLARAPSPGRFRAGPPTTVYVARRKWHIDVGFAAADLGPLAFAGAEFPESKYVFFGFGDRHYLLAKNHDAPVLSGALWPGPGLVLLTTLRGTPAAAFGPSQVIEMELSAAQARAIQTFIRSSIANSAEDVPAPYDKGPYEGSLYYSASVRYSAFHTCNTWAAEALSRGDVRVRARGVIFASQLWRQVRKLAAAEPARLAAPQSP